MPVIQRFEEPMDNAVFTPQHEQRAPDLARCGLCVVEQVDRCSRPVVFAACVNGRRITEASFVFDERARIEMPKSGAEAAELATKVVDGIANNGSSLNASIPHPGRATLALSARGEHRLGARFLDAYGASSGYEIGERLVIERHAAPQPLGPHAALDVAGREYRRVSRDRR